MLTNVDKCWQMLTNVDKCWQMLTNVDKCWQMLTCLRYDSSLTGWLCFAHEVSFATWQLGPSSSAFALECSHTPFRRSVRPGSRNRHSLHVSIADQKLWSSPETYLTDSRSPKKKEKKDNYDTTINLHTFGSSKGCRPPPKTFPWCPCSRYDSKDVCLSTFRWITTNNYWSEYNSIVTKYPKPLRIKFLFSDV